MELHSIVTAEDTTLVIAGAGTGKTSTIVGKVDYLIRRKLAAPSEILVLAFARKASEELQERLGRFSDAGAADISTFHALGNHIIGQVEGKRPSLSKFAEDSDASKRFLRDRVRIMLEANDGRELITQWLPSIWMNLKRMTLA